MTGDYKLHLVETFEEAEDFLRWLSQDRVWLGCDTETDGLIFGRERVRLTQFGDAKEGWSIPFNRWGGLVQDVFNRYEGHYVFHNAKFDLSRLAFEGIKIPKWRQVHDTYVMSFLHDNQEPNRKLKRLTKKYVGIDSEKGERLLQDYFRKTGNWWNTVPIDLPLYWEYAALDASLTAMLAEKLWPQAQQYAEAYDTEMAAIKVLMKMELNGVQVDMDYTLSTLDKMRQEQDDLVYFADENGLKDVMHLRDPDIRPNYTADIIQHFTGLGIPVPIKRSKKSGKISVDDEVLSKMDHEDAEKIQKARHLKSWSDNYLQKIVDTEYKGRVHPHINPLGSDDKGRTGRMSIQGPALSVLEKSALIRDCIIAGQGKKLVAIDYQNEELRIIASLCRSRGMIEAFAKGLDMHRQTASKMYGIPMEEVTSSQKTNAKRAMFTKAYGGKEKTFSAYIGLSYEEGARYYHTLSQLYPELDAFIEGQKQLIKSNKVDGYGHIFLSDGRKLNIPADISFKAVSYSSQGEGAVVLKKKLVQLDAAGFGEMLRLPNHDEVILEMEDKEIEDGAAEEARQIMECFDFEVPLTCDIEIMQKWGDEYREEDNESV